MNSNIDIFDDESGRKILAMDIKRFMYAFLVFLVAQTFFHVFDDDNNKLEMNIFIRLSDVLLDPDKWDIKEYETMWGTKYSI